MKQQKKIKLSSGKELNQENQKYIQFLLLQYKENLDKQTTYNFNNTFIQNILDHRLFNQVQNEYETEIISEVEKVNNKMTSLRNEKKIIGNFMKSLESEQKEQKKNVNVNQGSVEKSQLFANENDNEILLIDGSSDD